MFGYILRLPEAESTPAQQAMSHYFQPSKHKCFRGGRRITLPVTISKDLSETDKHNPNFYNKFKSKNLENITDLEHLKQLANDRKTWTIMTKLICNAAEAVTQD